MESSNHLPSDALLLVCPLFYENKIGRVKTYECQTSHIITNLAFEEEKEEEFYSSPYELQLIYLNYKNKYYTHYHLFDTHPNTHTPIYYIYFLVKSIVKLKKGFNIYRSNFDRRAIAS